MKTNGILEKHWFHVSLHFTLDAIFFLSAFVLGICLRFGEDYKAVLGTHWPFAVMSAFVLSCATYTFGLYSTHSSNQGFFKRMIILAFCVAGAAGLMIGLAYVDSSRPPGRGVMLLGAILAYASILLHHGFLLHNLRSTRERVAYIVTCAFDEVETRLFQSLGGHTLDLAGLVTHNGYSPAGQFHLLGSADALPEIVKREKVSRVLCTNKSLNDAALCRLFSKLRYSGISVMPLISLCEELDQYIPLELVSPEWLFNASGEPHLLYIKKVKRLFDLVVSFIGILLSLPILLLAMLAVKLTSKGPVFYHQRRSGRFGRDFEIVKLRTMSVDAEKDGAVWASRAGDPRVTPIGRFLRKYRIDEIPQLFHVFMGHMSFVGPRPERPEMIKDLAAAIPHYQERSMVQPGITGWAQVNYPYGASVEDARRKLEYDLYYMKHMSLFLDVFILLDTVRIVLTGGVEENRQKDDSRRQAMEEWSRRKFEHDQPLAPMPEPRHLTATQV